MTLGLAFVWAITQLGIKDRLFYALPTSDSAIAVAKVYFGSVYGKDYPTYIEKYQATLKGDYWVVSVAKYRADAGMVEPFFLVLERRKWGFSHGFEYTQLFKT